MYVSRSAAISLECRRKGTPTDDDVHADRATTFRFTIAGLRSRSVNTPRTGVSGWREFTGSAGIVMPSQL